MKFWGVQSVLFYKLILIIDLINGKLTNERDKYDTITVEAVEGRSAELPCPITAPLKDVYMVLWFKDKAGIPLYSFDVRDKIALVPTHWSAPEVFGSRAKFNIDKSPASLLIKDIKRHDQGIYRCRIDFRTSQTQSFRFNLSVIIPPEQPVVLDRWGRFLNTSFIGPLQEADDVMLSCRVVGGRPQPEVRWLINGVLVDDQLEHNSGDVIENRLLWPTIQRRDLHSVFTCQAMNTKLVEPKETIHVLDMHLKPLTVDIVSTNRALVADKRYEISCESTGSRPNAIITWYKGKRQLRRTKDDIMNNTTLSTLSFSPTTEDDGKQLTCRAENPSVNGLFLETSWQMNIIYPPIVTTNLGTTLSPDDIKEGDDVYFECHVKSNPPWKKLLWHHNGIQLLHNTSARIIQTNQSLVLQKITRFSAGKYACSAINAEGETVSNQLFLRVKYAPICATEKVALIGAAKNENVEILCEIYADPPARSFRWRFNNTMENIDLDPNRYSNEGNVSLLQYTPVADQDYGTLSCWGVNLVGVQNHPCLFQVVLAGLPSPVNNCTFYNKTQQFVEIQCTPGYDGGLPQMFVLELISKRSGTRRYNFSNMNEPYFVLDAIDKLSAKMTAENNSLIFVIYSVNQKGRSRAILLKDLEIGRITPFKTTNKPPLEASPILIGVILTILVLIVVVCAKTCLINFVSKCRRRAHSDNTKIGEQSKNVLIISSSNLKSEACCLKLNGGLITKTEGKTKSAQVDEEKDPDVIPSQFITTSPAVTPECNLFIQETYASANSLHLYPTSSSMYYKSQYATIERSSNIKPVIFPLAPMPKVNGSDMDINVIKDRLMTTRVPESCV